MDVGGVAPENQQMSLWDSKFGRNISVPGLFCFNYVICGGQLEAERAALAEAKGAGETAAEEVARLASENERCDLKALLLFYLRPHNELLAPEKYLMVPCNLILVISWRARIYCRLRAEKEQSRTKPLSGLATQPRFEKVFVGMPHF